MPLLLLCALGWAFPNVPGVYTFGSNLLGQLGIGDPMNRSLVPVRVNIDGEVSHIAAGLDTSIVLTDIARYGWGAGDYSALGVGNEENYFSPVVTFPGFTDVKAFGAGLKFFFVRHGTKTVAWGRNDFGNLGLGTISNVGTPVDTPIPGDALFFGCGHIHTIVATTTGLFGAGINNHGQVGRSTSSTFYTTFGLISAPNGTVINIACGWDHSVVVTTSSLYTFGDGRYGQLGTGSQNSTFEPQQVAIFDYLTVLSVGCGYWHTTVWTDGGIYSFGRSVRGALGLGATVQQDTPELVSGISGTVLYISVGLHHTFVKTTTGLYAWGANGDGQLGLGHQMDRNVPTLVPGSVGAETMISAGIWHTILVIGCPPVANMSSSGSILSCASRTGTRITGCAPGFYHVTGSTADEADACAQCEPIDDCGVVPLCTGIATSTCSACLPRFTLNSTLVPNFCEDITDPTANISFRSLTNNATFEIHFSEPVSTPTFTIGGSAPGAPEAIASGSMWGTMYYVEVRGLTGMGTVSLSLGPGAAVDLAGNPSVPAEALLTYDPFPPLMTVTRCASGSGEVRTNHNPECFDVDFNKDLPPVLINTTASIIVNATPPGCGQFNVMVEDTRARRVNLLFLVDCVLSWHFAEGAFVDLALNPSAPGPEFSSIYDGQCPSVAIVKGADFPPSYPGNIRDVVCFPGHTFPVTRTTCTRIGDTHVDWVPALPITGGAFPRTVSIFDCEECLAGTYADGGYCTPCPRGTWSDARTAVSSDVCVACPAGTYSNVTNATSPLTCLDCPAGETSPAGAFVCSPCLKGQYAVGTECFDCEFDFEYAPAGSVGGCSTCLQGHIPSVDRGACEPCQPGWYATAGSAACEPCGAHEVPNALSSGCVACGALEVASASSIVCRQCPTGSVRNADLSDCIDCGPTGVALVTDTVCRTCLGGFRPSASRDTCEACLPFGWAAANSSECRTCGPGQRPSAAQDACEPCPPGQYAVAGSADCVPCPSATLEPTPRGDSCHCRPQFFSPSATPQQCEECPAGAKCSGGQNLPKNNVGFYCVPSQDGQAVPVFAACKQEEACLEECRCREFHDPGTTGCGGCSRGAFREFENSLCEKCPSTPLAALILLVGGLGVIFSLGVVYVARRSKAYFTSLRVGMNFLQIIVVIGQLSVTWPGMLHSLFRALRFFTLELDLVRPECALVASRNAFVTIWYLKFFTPIFVLVFFLFLYAIAAVYTYNKYKNFSLMAESDVFDFNEFALDAVPRKNTFKSKLSPWREHLRGVKYNLVNAYLTMVTVMYLLCALTVFEAYTCYAIKQSDGSSVSVLAADPSIQCTGDHGPWAGLVTFATLGLVIYVIGVPVVFFVLLRRNRYKLSQPYVMAKFGLLYRRYTSSNCYWEITIMVRKLVLVIFHSAVRAVPYLQITACLITALVASAFHYRFQPYVSRDVNRLEQLCLGTACVILLAAYGFGGGEGESQGTGYDVLGALCILVWCACIVVVLYFFALELARIQRRKRVGIPDDDEGDDIEVLPDFYKADCRLLSSRAALQRTALCGGHVRVVIAVPSSSEGSPLLRLCPEDVSIESVAAFNETSHDPDVASFVIQKMPPSTDGRVCYLIDVLIKRVDRYTLHIYYGTGEKAALALLRILVDASEIRSRETSAHLGVGLCDAAVVCSPTHAVLTPGTTCRFRVRAPGVTSISLARNVRKAIRNPEIEAPSTPLELKVTAIDMMLDRVRDDFFISNEVMVLPGDAFTIKAMLDGNEIVLFQYSSLSLPTDMCEVCDEAEAELDCDDCALKYCQPCFNHKHKRSKRSHQALPINAHQASMSAFELLVSDTPQAPNRQSVANDTSLIQ